MGIKDHVAMGCTCCDAIDVDTRSCPRAGAQVNQPQSLVHVISRTLKQFGVPHPVESGERFSADRNLRIDIVVSGTSLREAPNREYRASPSCWTSTTRTQKRSYNC